MAESFVESSTSQTYAIPFTVSDPEGVFLVTATAGANSTWFSEAVQTGANGHDTLLVTVRPYAYSTGNSNVVLTAFSSQGSAGMVSTAATIALSCAYEHLDFEVTPPAAITIPESSASGALTGIGTFLIANANNDQFTYTITSNPESAFSINSNGVIFENAPIAWSPVASNSYTLGISVSNGAYTHASAAVINVTDNSPPILSFTPHFTNATAPQLGSYITGITIYAADPHGLMSSFAITGQTDRSGNVYKIDSTGWTGTVSYAYISVLDSPHSDQVTDSITVAATDSQGLTTSKKYAFRLGDSQVTPNVAHADGTAHLLAAIASFTGSGAASATLGHMQGGFLAGPHAFTLAAAHH